MIKINQGYFLHDMERYKKEKKLYKQKLKNQNMQQDV